MASRTAQTAAKSAKRQNEFGADLWVKDQSKTYRHPTGGRGMFAGLQDAKHYNVEGGWAKRAPDERPGFFSWLYNRIRLHQRRPPWLTRPAPDDLRLLEWIFDGLIWKYALHCFSEFAFAF
ncbi:hypothetical protein C8Q69DRAFT_44287 [Paecilomyces variotii]|uniref:Uncharacterized protein n=1 Tax=Byssochlamys spectabilis TaxID=264951 RepID=A0A443I7G2_BYSSP|nr:hypothetical protein C8Q69DRAFT_44287 [Paecilomyces variotii]RWQ99991.1 hypothetical protein C8Q69DRAFT_44287 [Paecilomyces variotii]